MKLLNCLQCHDIFQLSERKKHCRCKRSWGKYLKNDLVVEYSGEARVLGIDWRDYQKSIFTETKLDEEGKSTPKHPWFVIVEGQNIKHLGVAQR